MINKRLIVISWCLLSAVTLFSQCTDKQVLYRRLIFLRDSSASMSPTEKLKELMGYELQMKNCDYRFDSAHALLLQRIGVAYYARGEFVNAIRFTQLSIDLLHLSSGTPSINNGFLIKDYFNLALFYDSLNNLKGKITAVDSSISIGRRLHRFDELYLIALNTKTEYLFYIGDYNLCAAYASAGIETSRNYAGRNSSGYLLGFIIWKANTFINDRKYDEAESILHAAFNEVTGEQGKKYMGTLYELLAEVMINKENSAQALEFFQKAFVCDKQLGDELGCMQTLDNIVFLFYFKHLKDYRKAIGKYKEALVLAHKATVADVTEGWESLNILTNIANAYVYGGCYDSAFYYYQQAFSQVRPGLDETSLVDSLAGSFLNKRYIRYVAELVIDKGSAYLATNKNRKNSNYLSAAIKLYKLADQLVDKIKSYHFEAASKLIWQKNSRRLYENAIEACYLDNDSEDAFYFFEKGRAVLLSDQLSEGTLLAQNDIFEQGRLQRKIIDAENALKNMSEGSSTYSLLNNSILESKQQLYELQQAIKIRNPLYYQHLIDTSFITIEQVQHQILTDHKALIEVFSGDSAVYQMIIKEKKVALTRINKAAYDSATNLYLTYISNASLLNKNFADFVAASNYLYNLMFSGNELPAGRIIISPDGRYFPFEALIINSNANNVEYFLNKYAVSYTYSSRYLLNQFNTSLDADTKDFMGMAPVVYPNDSRLATLYGSDGSLKRLAAKYRNADILLFKDASKENFKNLFLKYRIVQLYTHAIDSGYNGEPVIYFSNAGLYLSDLVGIEKPVTILIVLSACNTGTGRVHAGEGVFSFNRGFAALGIPSSVINLWAADEESTIRLTELFYKYLNRGMPTDVALQKAKVEFIRTATSRTELPYYWAATVLAGRSDIIETNKPVHWLIAGIFAGFILMVVAFINYRFSLDPDFF